MLEEVKEHWIRKVNVAFETGSEDADNYLKWICFSQSSEEFMDVLFSPIMIMEKGTRLARFMAGLPCLVDHGAI